MSKNTLVHTEDLNFKILGKSIVQQAQDKEREATQGIVIKSVQEMLKSITHQESVVAKAQKMIVFQKNRIAALNEGKFTVAFESNLGGPVIRFNDADLNGSL